MGFGRRKDEDRNNFFSSFFNTINEG